MDPVLTNILEAIGGGGIAVVDGFLDAGATAALRADLERRRGEGAFRRAHVGRAAARRIADDIRRDEICWWDQSALADAQLPVVARFDALRSALNRELFLGLHRFEAHYATYAPGSFYGKHRDRFTGDAGRVLSGVLYLNDDWRDEDGGHLRIYGPEGATTADIAPRAGRFVCFPSADTYHEVLPTRRERCSVAAWFRRDESALPSR